jgi:FemAB-related protein (PEP-CTERM system-associated)
MLMQTTKVHATRSPVPPVPPSVAPTALEGTIGKTPHAISVRETIRPAVFDTPATKIEARISVYQRQSLAPRITTLTEFVRSSASLVPLSKHPEWLNILENALGHESYALEASAAGRTVGYLPLVHLDTLLFGKFLVSLPYLNTNGVIAFCPRVKAELVSRAISLADELNVRHLELRHETIVEHPGLNGQMDSKVHMRLSLPTTTEQLWTGFDSKVRNQIRKGEKHGFTIAWGGVEILPAFYRVLAENMRDLGSPFYGMKLFREILVAFPGNAEICLVQDKNRPVAAALLVHGWGVTEVPTASSLREYNPTNANMLMYWHLLQRAIERGQQVFDFGRSTTNGNTYRFKKQWGAEPHAATWQYRMNRGEVGEMRPDHPGYQRAIGIWRRLPLTVTQFLGPRIVRGIP